jgi:hypothetical protein
MTSTIPTEMASRMAVAKGIREMGFLRMRHPRATRATRRPLFHNPPKNLNFSTASSQSSQSHTRHVRLCLYLAVPSRPDPRALSPLPPRPGSTRSLRDFLTRLSISISLDLLCSFESMLSGIGIHSNADGRYATMTKEVARAARAHVAATRLWVSSRSPSVNVRPRVHIVKGSLLCSWVPLPG